MSSKRKRLHLVDHESDDKAAPSSIRQRSILQWLWTRESRHTKSIAQQQVQRTHRLSFTQLQTPPTEAVLGMDYTGSYLVSMEANEQTDRLELIRRAVPSNDVNRHHCRPASPVVQRIPLLGHIVSDGDNPITTLKLEIVLSHPIGVVRIQDSDCETATLWIFSEEIPQTCVCPNVRVGIHESYKMLWPVTMLPIITNKPEGAKSRRTWYNCQIQRVKKAYLLLHDEQDGFRLTWVAPSHHHETTRISTVNVETLLPSKNSTVGPDAPDIITHDSSWVGSTLVYAEAYLSIEQLLDNIRSKRRKLTGYGQYIPQYTYDLISLCPSGRYLNVIICFDNSGNSLSVHLEICLLTQAYRELQWNTKSAITGLEWWSQQLAYGQRLKELSVGPYSIAKANKRLDYICWKRELDRKEEACNNRSSSWYDYVNQVLQHHGKPQPPSFLQEAMLYSQCQVLTNEPVLTGTPVLSLTCPTGYTELVYNVNEAEEENRA